VRNLLLLAAVVAFVALAGGSEASTRVAPGANVIPQLSVLQFHHHDGDSEDFSDETPEPTATVATGTSTVSGTFTGGATATVIQGTAPAAVVVQGLVSTPEPDISCPDHSESRSDCRDDQIQDREENWHEQFDSTHGNEDSDHHHHDRSD